MKYVYAILSLLLSISLSSCFIEKYITYKPKIRNKVVFEDEDLKVTYHTLWIDIGNEFSFDIGFIPKTQKALAIKSIQATATLMDKEKNPGKKLLFKKLTVEQYKTSTWNYVYRSEKEYAKINSGTGDTYACSDTLSNLGNTYSYELTFTDEFFIREPLMHFDMQVGFHNLGNDSIFTKKYSMLFKRKGSVVFGIAHR